MVNRSFGDGWGAGFGEIIGYERGTLHFLVHARLGGAFNHVMCCSFLCGGLKFDYYFWCLGASTATCD